MVHTYEALGVKIAVDVNSGAVHVLDGVTFDLLRFLDGQEAPLWAEGCPAAAEEALPQHSPDALAEAWQELAELAAQGLLFEEDDYIDRDKAASMQQQALVKALCLHVSHDCNLRCKYCFASTGDFGTGRRMTMDADTAKRAIDFVVEKSGHRKNIEVDFFGGEPLMAMDTVKKTVEYARSIEEGAGKHFRFTITTNGVLLDNETIDYINREMSNAVLSLDGRREVNDDLRPTAGGKGSYDRIVPRFRRLIEGRGTKDYYLRGTFTRFHKDFAEDVKALAALGKNISVEPVVGKREDPYALQEEDLPELLAEYERLAEYLRDHREVNFFHFNVDLAQGPCVIKRLRGCGAGCEYVAVTPDGDIYPCHQFVGLEDYKLGSLYDSSFDRALSGKFAALNVYTREECRSCWARFYCSGGCSASNLLVNGDIRRPHRVGCELERKRLECAIALKAIDAGLTE